MTGPDSTTPSGIDFSDALFRLGCGCVIDGCSGSDPAQKWLAGRRDLLMYCVAHPGWEMLVDVVTPASPNEPADG